MYKFLTADPSGPTTADIDVLTDLATAQAFIDSVHIIPNPANPPEWGDYLEILLINEDETVAKKFGSYAIDPGNGAVIQVEQGSEGTYNYIVPGQKVRVIYHSTSATGASIAININAVF